MAMTVFTCAGGKHDLPGPLAGHPCAKAMRALDAAGHDYERRTVGGFKNVPFSIRGDMRREIVELTGQRDVPVLLLEDGTAIHGSDAIVRWAEAHPANAG